MTVISRDFRAILCRFGAAGRTVFPVHTDGGLMTNPLRMHIHDDATAALRERIFDYARDRMQLDPPPLDKGMPFAALRAISPQ